MIAKRFSRWAAVSGMLVVSALAVAQNQPGRPGQAPPEPLRPPVPKQAAKPPALMNILVAGAIIGGVLVVSLLNSKRGHQD